MRRAPTGAASGSSHNTSSERLKADRLVMGDPYGVDWQLMEAPEAGASSGAI